MRQSLEHDECVCLVQYLELLKRQGNKILYTHVNNEMYTKSWMQKHKAKMQGVTSGVPDYILLINDSLIFIEMKKPRARLKSGKESKTCLLSENQKVWIKYLKAANQHAFVCYGFEEARAVVDAALFNSEKLD